MGAVILTGDWSDFGTVISGEFGAVGEFISGSVTQFCLHLRNPKRIISVIVSGQMVHGMFRGMFVMYQSVKAASSSSGSWSGRSPEKLVGLWWLSWIFLLVLRRKLPSQNIHHAIHCEKCPIGYKSGARSRREWAIKGGTW